MFEFFVTTYGGMILKALMYALFGCIGYAVKEIIRLYLNDLTKLSIAKSAVNFVEQVWKDIHGNDKLMKALEKAEELLKKKGIEFDADEMMVLIESAVKEMNDVIHKQESQQLTIKAGDYVGTCVNDTTNTNNFYNGDNE